LDKEKGVLGKEKCALGSENVKHLRTKFECYKVTITSASYRPKQGTTNSTTVGGMGGGYHVKIEWPHGRANHQYYHHPGLN
jgi:hypothetical protein